MEPLYSVGVPFCDKGPDVVRDGVRLGEQRIHVATT